MLTWPFLTAPPTSGPPSGCRVTDFRWASGVTQRTTTSVLAGSSSAPPSVGVNATSPLVVLGRATVAAPLAPSGAQPVSTKTKRHVRRVRESGRGEYAL